MKSLLLKDTFKILGQVKWQKFKAGTKQLIAESQWSPNQVIATDGRGIYLFLDHLTGDDTYSIPITHADMGDDDTAATATDIDLGNGLERASIGAVSRSGSTATFRFFYADALTSDDTYKEFGMFIGSQLFSRAVFSSPYSKSSGENTRLDYKITLSAV